jgi:hypothetical protein
LLDVTYVSLSRWLGCRFVNITCKKHFLDLTLNERLFNGIAIARNHLVAREILEAMRCLDDAMTYESITLNVYEIREHLQTLGVQETVMQAFPIVPRSEFSTVRQENEHSQT